MWPQRERDEEDTCHKQVEWREIGILSSCVDNAVDVAGNASTKMDSREAALSVSRLGY